MNLKRLFYATIFFNRNVLDTERDLDNFHKKCRIHLYQIIQVELKGGSVYQGILHSYDKDKMYILMPKMGADTKNPFLHNLII